MKDRTNGAPERAGAGDNGDPEQSVAADRSSGGSTRAEKRIAALDNNSLAAMLDALKKELELATRAAQEAEAGWQRSRADFANFKRRNETERAERAGLASDSVLLKVVALADDFDLAIEHVPVESRGSPWVEGISAIDRKLRQLLESEGVKPMHTEGQPFDPREHQAVSYEDTEDAADGTVLKELQRGYYIRDRVLRPALVAVASNADTSTTDAASDRDKE